MYRLVKFTEMEGGGDTSPTMSRVVPAPELYGCIGMLRLRARENVSVWRKWTLKRFIWCGRDCDIPDLFSSSLTKRWLRMVHTCRYGDIHLGNKDYPESYKNRTVYLVSLTYEAEILWRMLIFISPVVQCKVSSYFSGEDLMICDTIIDIADKYLSRA